MLPVPYDASTLASAGGLNLSSGTRAASGRPFSFAYAASAAVFRDPRQPMKPSPAKPRSIIAQVDASGAEGVTAENSKAWVKPFTWLAGRPFSTMSNGSAKPPPMAYSATLRSTPPSRKPASRPWRRNSRGSSRAVYSRGA
jgi:hypothetical protein